MLENSLIRRDSVDSPICTLTTTSRRVGWNPAGRQPPLANLVFRALLQGQEGGGGVSTAEGCVLACQGLGHTRGLHQVLGLTLPGGLEAHSQAVTPGYLTAVLAWLMHC